VAVASFVFLSKLSSPVCPAAKFTALTSPDPEPPSTTVSVEVTRPLNLTFPDIAVSPILILSTVTALETVIKSAAAALVESWKFNVVTSAATASVITPVIVSAAAVIKFTT